MRDEYDWHNGKDITLGTVCIKDEWALLVKDELKKAKNFKEKGTWKGERAINCCGDLK